MEIGEMHTYVVTSHGYCMPRRPLGTTRVEKVFTGADRKKTLAAAKAYAKKFDEVSRSRWAMVDRALHPTTVVR